MNKEAVFQFETTATQREVGFLALFLGASTYHTIEEAMYELRKWHVNQFQRPANQATGIEKRCKLEKTLDD